MSANQGASPLASSGWLWWIATQVGFFICERWWDKPDGENLKLHPGQVSVAFAFGMRSEEGVNRFQNREDRTL